MTDDTITITRIPRSFPASSLEKGAYVTSAFLTIVNGVRISYLHTNKPTDNRKRSKQKCIRDSSKKLLIGGSNFCSAKRQGKREDADRVWTCETHGPTKR